MAYYLTAFIKHENNYQQLNKIVEEYSSFDKAKEKLTSIVDGRKAQGWVVEYMDGDELKNDMEGDGILSNILAFADINQPNTINTITYTITKDEPPWEGSSETPMFPEAVDVTGEIQAHALGTNNTTSVYKWGVRVGLVFLGLYFLSALID